MTNFFFIIFDVYDVGKSLQDYFEGVEQFDVGHCVDGEYSEDGDDDKDGEDEGGVELHGVVYSNDEQYNRTKIANGVTDSSQNGSTDSYFFEA